LGSGEKKKVGGASKTKSPEKKNAKGEGHGRIKKARDGGVP